MEVKQTIEDGHGFWLGKKVYSFMYMDCLGPGRLCDRVPFVHISDTDIHVANIWFGGPGNGISLISTLCWHLRSR